MPSPLATPQPLSAAGRAEHGEGPVWDHRLQRLYWVDIINGQLHWLDAGAHERCTREIGEPLGFIALTTDPRVVVIGRSAALAFMTLETGKLDAFVRLESDDARLRCNDGKCDPSGRLWAGTIPRDPSGKPPGALYSVTHDGELRREVSDVGCSNGLAWNPERREFYFIDSLAHRIDHYRWDSATGLIGTPSVLAKFADNAGLPDGMCIDADGNLWVAFWDGGCVRHIDGRTGATLATLPLPVKRVTSCTFGGPDLSTLFISTSWVDLPPADRAAQPLAGSIFTVQTSTHGVPASFFPHPLTP